MSAYPEVVNRRTFLKGALLLAGATVSPLAQASRAANLGVEKGKALIDTNVTVGEWPFRQLPLEQTAALARKLLACGVQQAWTGTFDGLLHKNIAAANERLTRECSDHGRGLLIPFGAINPTLPGWEADLERCVREYRMPGIRLHPNYHGYKLSDPKFALLLERSAERKLIVQVAVSMEDERTQHGLARVPDVDPAPLTQLVRNHPGVRIVLLNWFRAVKKDLLSRLADSGAIYFDTAMIEGVGGVGTILQQVSPGRLLFGSHAPFFYFESALLKLKESVLTAEQFRAVSRLNAEQLKRQNRV